MARTNAARAREVADLRKKVEDLTYRLQDADAMGEEFGRYKPHPKQKLFHQAATWARKVFAIAGIRSGKSYAGARELKKRASDKPRSRWAFIAPTYPDCREILDYSLIPCIPPDEIESIQKTEHYIMLKNGSKIMWRSADNPESLRSLGDLDGVWLDEAEQFRPVVYDNLLGRVARLEGIMLITTSPQKYFGSESRKRTSWIYELLAEKGITITPDVVEYQAGDTAVVNWTANDNPHFRPDLIEGLRQDRGPLWAAQELDGQYIDLYTEGIFRAEWFAEVETPPTEFDAITIVHDPAISPSAAADYSVAMVCGLAGSKDKAVDDRKVYVLEERRGRLNFPAQVEILNMLVAKYNAHKLLIEDVSYQHALVEACGGLGLPVPKHDGRYIGVRPDGCKEARAMRLSGPLSSGKVLFAPGMLTTDFLNEFTSFPCCRFDDRVDALGYAVQDLLTGRRRHMAGDYKPLLGKPRRNIGVLGSPLHYPRGGYDLSKLP